MEKLLQKIDEENREIKRLLDSLSEIPSSGWEEREKVFSELKKLLRPHLQATEQILFPAFLARTSREEIMQLSEEHHFLDLVINELDDMSKQAEHWGPKEKVLREFLLGHLEKEQLKTDSVLKSSSKEFISRLEEKYEETEERVRKEMAQQSTHP